VVVVASTIATVAEVIVAEKGDFYRGE